MDIKIKIACFEYFLKGILSWHSVKYRGQLLVLTKVKALKLLFLTSAIKCDDGNDLLDIFDRFYAMKHGPVESDIYNAMMNDKLLHYSFKNTNIEVVNDSNIGNELSAEIRKRIDTSINQLMERNPSLINKTAFYLVEITHKWSCWQHAMEVASILGKGSYLMDTNSIRISNNSVFE